MIIDKPWGYYEDILRLDTIVFKRIVINPKHSISLQKHKNRSEFWVVENGHGKMELDGSAFCLNKGNSVQINKGQIHRITNMSSTNYLEIYEVQFGICSENDIERIEDKYGRADK